MYDIFNSIIHSSYAELFTIDAALFLLAAFGVGLMLFGRRKIKKHSKPTISITPGNINDEETEQPTTIVPKGGNEQHSSPTEMGKNIPAEPCVAPSLDAVYAKKNGLIVCKYCETINNRQRRICCACGNEIEQ